MHLQGAVVLFHGLVGDGLHGHFHAHAAGDGCLAGGVDGVDGLDPLAVQLVARMASRVAAQATMGTMQNRAMTTQFMPSM